MQDFLAKRRDLLQAELDPGTIAIISAYAPSQQLDYWLVRAGADFCYLTDLPQVTTNAWLILTCDTEPLLILWQSDNAQRIWEGQGVDFAAARKISGITNIVAWSQREEVLTKLLPSARQILINHQQDPDFVHDVNRMVAGTDVVVADIAPILHPLRLCKDEVEVERITQSVELAISAHASLWAGVEPGLSEQFLAAEFTYSLAMAGCYQQAYPAIVAGGNNANTLHHSPSKYELQESDLLLVDAGAVWHGYCSDITRTIPVSYKFSAEQKAVYELVLAAQEAAIATLLPGNTWSQVESSAVNVLAQGLLDIGIVQGRSQAQIIGDGTLRALYPHRIGHSLGLDVHDCQALTPETVLEAGMVVTIEPGLYLRNDNLDLAEKWRGIGVRIEDNLVIAADGPVNLTEALPRTVDDIETLL